MATADEFDVLVPDPQVRKELGDLSEVTSWRWDKYPEKAPRGWAPPIYIGPRKFRTRRMVEEVKANLIRRAVGEPGSKVA
jgi:hypothetical protein